MEGDDPFPSDPSKDIAIELKVRAQAATGVLTGSLEGAKRFAVATVMGAKQMGENAIVGMMGGMVRSTGDPKVIAAYQKDMNRRIQQMNPVIGLKDAAKKIESGVDEFKAGDTHEGTAKVVEGAAQAVAIARTLKGATETVFESSTSAPKLTTSTPSKTAGQGAVVPKESLPAQVGTTGGTPTVAATSPAAAAAAPRSPVTSISRSTVTSTSKRSNVMASGKAQKGVWDDAPPLTPEHAELRGQILVQQDAYLERISEAQSYLQELQGGLGEAKLVRDPTLQLMIEGLNGNERAATLSSELYEMRTQIETNQQRYWPSRGIFWDRASGPQPDHTPRWFMKF
jgi:hypothetical protein